MPDTQRITRRIRSRRDRLGLSQEQLARRAGFNHRQTVTAIEAGQRSISPEELAMLASVLDVDVAYFTDRFAPTGEATFSFRAEAGADEQVLEFEDRAAGWLATYQELDEREDSRRSLLLPALSLSIRSSFEDALAAAEDVRRRLGLGERPAGELEVALERDWGIPVLYFEAQPGISGAATRLGGFQAIFINRSESPGRRNFDLAHELFHLLTWDSMPPRRIDDDRPGREQKRVEHLADSFASALLMPETSVREAWADRREDGALEAWMAAAAAGFGVSAPAWKWRLRNLGLLDREDLPGDEALWRASTEIDSYDPTPLLFNATFVERIHGAVESGMLSLRKAGRILGMDTAAVAALCQAYGRPLSYEI